MVQAVFQDPYSSLNPRMPVLDIVGDRWSLLLVRDIGMYGKRTFTQMAASAEGIVPSTLADRLKRLLAQRIIARKQISGGPGRQYHYSLTNAGTDLLPVLVDMMQWSATYDPHTKVPAGYRKRLTRDREKIIKEFQSAVRARKA